MRVLVLNLATDADDPVLGFTTSWLRALARRVDVVHVITMRLGRLDLPNNVHVQTLGKEKGYSEPRRAMEFYRLARRLLRAESIDVCFSHMSPIMTVLAAPILKLRRIPIVTWYAHRSVPIRLRLAHRLSDRIVSVNESSYPYRRDKFVTLGHGIDQSLFSPGAAGPDEPPMLLSVGRMAPIKDTITLVKAVHLLRTRGQLVRCAIIGGEDDADRGYSEQVRQIAADLDLTDVVSIIGAMPQSELPGWYDRCFAHVNLSPPGALDKAPLEAMACGRPSLVANPGFSETLGRWSDALTFQHENAEDLAGKITALLDTADDERRNMALDLRERVVTQHGLDSLMDQLVDVLSDVSGVARTSGQPVG